MSHPHRWLLFFLILSAMLPHRLDAHGGEPARIRVERSLGGRFTIALEAPLRELVLAAPGFGDAMVDAPQLARDAAVAYVERHLILRADAQHCQRVGLAETRIELERGRLHFTARWHCPPAEPVRLRWTGFFELGYGHQALVTVVGSAGVDRVALLHAGNEEVEIKAASANLSTFVGHGLIHILSGVDHILFVAGLVLVAGALRRLLVAVTGFTLGHSLTLAAATLGSVAVSADVVEPLIALSIAYLGWEWWLEHHPNHHGHLRLVVLHLLLAAAAALGWLTLPAGVFVGLALFAWGLWQWRQRVQGDRFAVVLLPFAFGLVHGLGFAGPLLDLGLSGHDLVAALAGFNVGVELGQLGVIALLLAAVRLPGLQRVPRAAYAALLALVGLAWFAMRAVT